jgi:glucose/arabinose dehydrogenase
MGGGLPRAGARLLAVWCVLSGAVSSTAGAATLPTGFTEQLIASNLSSPTAMQIAPDGRIFVCLQGGQLRVVKNGALLGTPFLTVTVSSSGERGLLGVAFDPDFATNQYVYVYYTATTPTIHNRVSRFTANGDVAMQGSEHVIVDLETLSGATNHNGGAINFGLDGKLYVAVGDNANGSHAQTLANRLGKMLRLNPDGSIPTDNPFYGSATGANRAIWAMGLRNPFTFAIHPTGGSPDMLINDVGQSTYEEINDGIAGANYGWPYYEGPTTDPEFVSPRHYYGRSGGCAITGGAFYAPQTAMFPAEYLGDYFFADYCSGWIHRLDPANGNAVAGFATGLSSPVDLKTADDGSLYYLQRGNGGRLYRVTYGASAPTITAHPANVTVQPGTTATFSVQASGTPPLRYQWQRGGADITGATSSSYSITPTPGDSGARFRVRVTNDIGSVFSNEAVLTVSQNQPPTAAIGQPSPGAQYGGGQVIAFSGTGTDPEQGTLPASAFTWRVDFHHDTHLHPFVPATPGITGGTFTIPTTGETSANVWYRIHLTVRDAAGLTDDVYRDIQPRRVRLTLATTPPGLQVRLDGQPTATPVSFDGVVGIVRSLSAFPQVVGSVPYEFQSWSDGGAAEHTIVTPAVDTTYTATYRRSNGPPDAPTGLDAYINGLTVELGWNGSPGAQSYQLEAGSSTGLADLFAGDVGPGTVFETVAPAGLYFVRVRGLNAFGAGPASEEIQVRLTGSHVCTSPAPAPTGFAALVAGVATRLSWISAPSASSYIIEAGSAPGLADVYRSDVGRVLGIIATAPAGRYYVRVRAANSCGTSAPSPEIAVALGCATNPVAPPTGLTVTRDASRVLLQWSGSLGHTGYRLQVGSTPGASDVMDADVGPATSWQALLGGVSPGVYYVRVRATTGCGLTGPSNEQIVTVP